VTAILFSGRSMHFSAFTGNSFDPLAQVLLAKEPRQIPTSLASRPATIHLRENAQTQRSEYHNAPSDAHVLPKTIVENTGLSGSMPTNR
jgi:hypothetical protein